MERTITQVVYQYLDNLQDCEITGWQLFDIVKDVTGRSPYPTTLLQMARVYADITGGDFRCVDTKHSVYHFTPNVKLGNAIIDRR